MAIDLTQISGKRIYELETILAQSLKKDAFFVVSQDNLTRSITLKNLKESFKAIPGNSSDDTYYSSTQVDNLLSDFNQQFNSFLEQFQQVKSSTEQLTDKIQTVDNTLNTRITKIYNELKTADTELQKSVNNQVLGLSKSISNVRTDLDSKINDWILHGYDAPTTETCPVGRTYIQLFK